MGVVSEVGSWDWGWVDRVGGGREGGRNFRVGKGWVLTILGGRED